MLFKEPNEAASALDPATNSKPLARIATARELDFDMAKILKISTTDMPNAGTGYRFFLSAPPRWSANTLRLTMRRGRLPAIPTRRVGCAVKIWLSSWRLVLIPATAPAPKVGLGMKNAF